jgi:hypothetical protein
MLALNYRAATGRATGEGMRLKASSLGRCQR